MKFLFLLFSIPFFAQVGIGTTTPNGALEINSSQYGVVLVKASLTSETDTTTITNPNGGSLVEGTIVYNDGLSGLKPAGFYYWRNNRWNCNACKREGELKYSFKTTDHGGWYLLDGRLISTLPANAQTAAVSLGLTTNLPNASDKFLKGKNGSEVIGSTVGSNSVTIAQANIQNYSLPVATTSTDSHSHTGTTSSDGAHTHTYTDKGDLVYNSPAGAGNPMAAATSGSYTTSSAGAHTHTLTTNSYSHSHTVTVTSGGSGTPLNVTPSCIVTNVFIYLGQ